MSEFAVDTSIYSDRRSPLRWVVSHVLRHKLFLILIFIGAFFNASLASLVPILIGVAFDAALATPAYAQDIAALDNGESQTEIVVVATGFAQPRDTTGQAITVVTVRVSFPSTCRTV